MKHTILFSLLTLTTLVTLNVHAAGKHVHGEAEIFIAIDGNTVLVDFESPADNIIGFEHAPKNEKQQKTLSLSINRLENHKNLMTINGGQCAQVKNNLEAPFTEHHEKHDEHKHKEHGHEKHDEHKHKEHGHEKHDEHKHKEHGHEKHDEHQHIEHGHEKHDEQEDSHSDFFASYTLECLNPKNINNINIKAFDLFSKLETIQVKWVNSDSQGSQKTNRKNRTLSF